MFDLLKKIFKKEQKVTVYNHSIVEETKDTLIVKSNKENGLVEGKHYTEYIDIVKDLKRQKSYDKAIVLLNKLIDGVENESKVQNCGVAPWYYEQLAIVYRKVKMRE